MSFNSRRRERAAVWHLAATDLVRRRRNRLWTQSVKGPPSSSILLGGLECGCTDVPSRFLEMTRTLTMESSFVQAMFMSIMVILMRSMSGGVILVSGLTTGPLLRRGVLSPTLRIN